MREREELIRHAASASDASGILSASSLKPEGKTGPVQPPYLCSFDDATVFEQEWDLADGDGDGKTWDYKEDGYIISRFCSKKEVANFLITKYPVQMTAGDAYVAFRHSGMGTRYKERFKVYYGKTADTNRTTLTLIGELIDSSTAWKLDVLPFKMAEAGDYYFFFVHCADANQYDFKLDDVEINTGTFRGTPNLVVNRVVLPLSSCALGHAEPIGVQISNLGTATITKIKLSYTIDGSTPVEETATLNLEADQSEIVYFEQKADFSNIGDVYEVSVKVDILESDGKEEVQMDDNVGKSTVRNFEPLESLPFTADLTDTDNLKKLGYDAALWTYDTVTKSLNALMPEPMVTMCFPLEANQKYRLTFDYMAGAKILWFPIPDNFDILYGPAGTPVEDWTVLASHTDEYTEDAFVTNDLIFENKTAGNYSVAFWPKAAEGSTYSGTVYIAKINFSKLQTHDVKVENILADIGVLTPAHHAVKPNFNVLVSNKGIYEEHKVNVTLTHGEEVIGKSDSVSLKSDSAVVLSMEGTLTRPEIDSVVTLTIQATMQEEDGYPADNQMTWSFKATKDLYAFDDVTIEKYEDGVGSPSNSIGNIFALAEQDTLTAVVLGLFDVTEYADEPYKARLEIYPVKDDGTAGIPLLSYDFVRQIAGGLQTVQMPARVLPAGRYLVAVRQLTTNVALGYDENPNGFFYATKGREITVMTAYGHLALRAVFGSPETVIGKDIEMLEIQKPRDNGSFSANEKVVGTYINHGHLETDVVFQCKIDGTVTGTQNVKVPAYGSGTVEFTADLSAAGVHLVTIEANVDADEMPGNNKVEKTVTCHIIDPYVMNFEICEDFAIDNLQPWQTVDMDGTTTYGIEGFTWPNMTEKMGFMAFDPTLTSPSMEKFMAAHGGNRFGAAIASAEDVANNDWLISPKLQMPAKGSQLSFYTMSFQGVGPYKERYNVLVSENSDDPNDFKQLGDTYTAPENWTKTVVDLSAYDGKEIHIAIQCVSDTQFMFMIDDIMVSKPVPNENMVDLSRYVKAYPNPVTDVWTVTAYDLNIQRVEICNMTGNVVFRSANNLNTETYRVSMGGFTPGLYTARVLTNAGVQTLKIMVR